VFSPFPGYVKAGRRMIVAEPGGRVISQRGKLPTKKRREWLPVIVGD